MDGAGYPTRFTTNTPSSLIKSRDDDGEWPTLLVEYIEHVLKSETEQYVNDGHMMMLNLNLPRVQ